MEIVKFKLSKKALWQDGVGGRGDYEFVANINGDETIVSWEESGEKKTKKYSTEEVYNLFNKKEWIVKWDYNEDALSKIKSARESNSESKQGFIKEVMKSINSKIKMGMNLARVDIKSTDIISVLDCINTLKKQGYEVKLETINSGIWNESDETVLYIEW